MQPVQIPICTRLRKLPRRVAIGWLGLLKGVLVLARTRREGFRPRGFSEEKRTRKNQNRNPFKCNIVYPLGEIVELFLVHRVKIVRAECQLHSIAAFGISAAINKASKGRRKRFPDIQSDSALSWCMVQERTEDGSAGESGGGGIDNIKRWWIGNTVVVHFKDFLYAWKNVHDVGGFKVQRCST